MSPDKSTWYRGELAIVYGTANPNEELVWSVTYPNNTIFVWSDVGPVIADSEGNYETAWIWHESELVEPYGIYKFEIYSPKCDCSADTSVELIEEPIELTTTLTFDIIPPSAVDQQVITFTGHLIRSDTGEGVNNALISIIDRDVGFLQTNDTLATGYTNQDGYFSIPWTAYCEDQESPNCSLEIFAEFSGTSTLPKSNTPIYHLAIVSQISTLITLDQPESPVIEGNTVTFTGRLTRSDTGEGLSGYTVYLYDLDRSPQDGEDDDLMGTAVTNGSGYYNITWIAEDVDDGDNPSDADAYAYFPGTVEFESSSSLRRDVEVIPDTIMITSLQFDDQQIVIVGETMSFTGRLIVTDTGEGISGMKIIIYESDVLDNCFFNCQNKSLASGITDTNGYYSINWNSFCEDTAEASNCRLEVFARFGGDSDYRFSKSELKYVTFKQLIQTSLVFDTPASNVNLDDSITFTGRLSESSSNVGIPSMNVSIFDYDGATSELLATGETNSDGIFNIDWVAEDMDTSDDTLELFASFGGTVDYKPSQHPANNYYLLNIITPKADTEIIIDELPPSILQGKTLKITGQLIQSDNGEGIPNAQIKIIDYDPVLVSDLIGTTITNQDGSFSFEWIAECTDNLESICIIELYASFEGNTLLKSSETLAYDLQINTKSQTVLSLNEPPSTVISGTEITFTGRLVDEEGNGISGATVEILDFDVPPIGIFDDILAVGITNDDGFFEVFWTVEDTDQDDDILEIYAMFRGNDNFMSSSSPDQYYKLEITREDVFPPQVVVNHLPQDPTILDDIVFEIAVDDGLESSGLDTVQLFVDGNVHFTWELGDEFTNKFSISVMDELEIGEHTYWVIALDLNGNWGSDPLEGAKTIIIKAELDKSDSFLSLEFEQDLSEGDVVEFTGTLRTSDGLPIPDVIVNIFDQDVGDNELITYTQTNENGYYSVKWTVECLDDNTPCIMGIFAQFDGSRNFHKSTSLIFDTEIFVQFKQLDGSAICLGKFCNNRDIEPIPNAYVKLVVGQDSYHTYSDWNGDFSFTGVDIKNGDSFTLTVSLTDDKYVKIASKSFNFKGFIHSGGIYRYVYEGRYLDNIDSYEIVFGCLNSINLAQMSASFCSGGGGAMSDKEKADMNAATIYTYSVIMADYMLNELQIDVIQNYGVITTYIFTSNSEGWSGVCYCGINPVIELTNGVNPSQNNNWKDTVGMEYVHAIHSLNGGFRCSIFDQDCTNYPSKDHSTWWIESIGRLFPEAMQYELGDTRGSGIDIDASIKHGDVTSCGLMNLDSVSRYLPPGTSRAHYCNTAAIIWDFYDHPSIPDSNSSFRFQLIFGEDESAEVPLKTLWDILTTEPVPNIRQFYLTMINVDVNNDGRVDSLDMEIVNSIFDMHQVPGGIPQN